MNLMSNDSFGEEGKKGAKEVITILLLYDSRHLGVLLATPFPSPH